MESFGTNGLATSSPSEEGVEARGIESFLDSLESLPGVEAHSLMILRHGSVIVAGWWWPYTTDQLQLLYSVSKSFTSTALGLAVDDGLLDLDDPIVAHFPELDDQIGDPRSRSMRIRHIAAMASGHLEDTWPEVLASDPEHPVLGFLRLQPERDPGSIFRYNQSASYTLAAIVQRVTGQSVTQYLRSRVLDPIGAGPIEWWGHPQGQDLGFSGLHATTETVARLGQLYLNDGSWHGRQILSSAWIEQASREQVGTDTDDPAAETGADSKLGYGYQFWKSSHGYRADGAFGQFCLILPEFDAVIAMTGQSTETQPILDAVWNELLPSFKNGEVVEDFAGDRRLQERMASLALVTSGARLEPPRDADNWAEAVFRPVLDSWLEQPTIESLKVSPAAHEWNLVLTERDWTLDMRLANEWSRCYSNGVAQPIFCSGGWPDPRSLKISLIFIESPHRLDLTCTLDDRRLIAKWVTAPLHPGPLRDLRVRRRGPVTWLTP
ncbi:MAG: beta-lactamase family protein [Acidobacteria bacterium]|nr:beta-lactamase family protein [Acidobacteriota bacterium]